jgi:predicted HicB family RNase H-like nuclease
MARPKLYDEERVQTNVRIPKSLHERLAEEAHSREIGVNLLIVNAITEYLDNLPPIPLPRPHHG